MSGDVGAEVAACPECEHSIDNHSPGAGCWKLVGCPCRLRPSTILAQRVEAAKAEAWPCANYTAPVTCVAAKATTACLFCATMTRVAKAEAWDEGWATGMGDAAGLTNGTQSEVSANPYRAAALDAEADQ